MITNPTIKASDLIKILPSGVGEELLSECDWSSDDVIVLTVSEVFGSHETSFKSICLDEEHNLADMDREYDEVPVSKRELTGYIVSHATTLLQMIEDEDESKLELSGNSDVQEI